VRLWDGESHKRTLPIQPITRAMVGRKRRMKRHGACSLGPEPFLPGSCMRRARGALDHAGRRDRRARDLHRGLVQSAAPALDPGLSESRRV